MRFLFHREAPQMNVQAQQSCFLLTNGLGGYCSVTGEYSVPRCDQGILVAAVKAPNVRINLVHRLSEKLIFKDREIFLSSQAFADGDPSENGQEYLESFCWEYVPQWQYEVSGIRVVRKCCMEHGKNTAAVLYEIHNPTGIPCKLEITPYLKFAPKEEPMTVRKDFCISGSRISADGYEMSIYTDGSLHAAEPDWQMLAYPEDAKDGRPEKGMAGSCCKITKTAAAGRHTQLEVVFTTEKSASSGWDILDCYVHRMKGLETARTFTDPAARQLMMSADAYIACRESTNGKTILAGYPLFSDWGRDTMIALPGCCLAAGRYEDAKSILQTFLAYEKDGLVPNLFPEGDQVPMYNTVDAALLLIDCVWQYAQATGDWVFVRGAWDILERIVTCYRTGTHHAIGMDEDGLIFAGRGLDQVTWMDVCVQGILPTPRHGKPVEINAYWYNALKIMENLAKKLDLDGRDYGQLAKKVQNAFVQKFYIPEKGFLRDVLSGTQADEQIRCNQIWALSMSFTMLDREQEKQVLNVVQKHLYTPFGLRTLSPEDPQYHPYYGGEQLKRDLAYHQGTTWVFPMGAYYRAYLKVYEDSPEAVAAVKRGLENLYAMMAQGCVGQLPEIYDGDSPREGKGCFAQAWSVGEILRVYETLDRIEKEKSNEIR